MAVKSPKTKKNHVKSYDFTWFLLGGRGWLGRARAAKNEPQARFCPVFGDGAAAVRIRPLTSSKSHSKQKADASL
jgi:hypothetical protein